MKNKETKNKRTFDEKIDDKLKLLLKDRVLKTVEGNYEETIDNGFIVNKNYLYF